MERDKQSDADLRRELDDARKAEINERRRQTRAENRERERIQDEQLFQETQGQFYLSPSQPLLRLTCTCIKGGRDAKNRARANAGESILPLRPGCSALSKRRSAI